MSPRLWGFRLSPYAGRVRAAFIEKGVDDVELVEVHPAKRPQRLKELNPNGRVPVLEVNGRALRESLNICDWIEETYPEPALWPADPTEKAHARGFTLWLDMAVTQQFFLGMNRLAFGVPDGEVENIVDLSFERFARGLPKLENALGETPGPWFLGDTFSYADLAGQALAVRLPEWRPDLVPEPGTYPAIEAWFEALRARPSVAGVDQKGTRADELGYA